MAKERKLCTYPMNLFFSYEDEVPADTRVSTPNDCIECHDCMDDDYCDATHCLISEKKND